MHNKKPAISVLMANYNNGPYISQAIDSVLRQTFFNWELLILDDCSRDNSRDIIKGYLKDKRIKFYKNSVNRGYTGSLKKLIKISNSEILGILDPDDALRDDALLKIVQAYSENLDSGFIYSQFVYCDQNLNPQKNGYCAKIFNESSNLFCNCVSHFKTFKKSEYLKTDGYDENILYAEDKDLILKMEEVTRLFFLDEALYYYRVLPNSQGHDYRKFNTGKISFAMARYNAYKRRKNKKIIKISGKEMGKILTDPIEACFRMREYKKLIFFISRSVLISRFHISVFKVIFQKLKHVLSLFLKKSYE